MNAAERRQRALEFRASTKVSDSIDYSRHAETGSFVPRFERNHNKFNRDLCHGVCLPTDHIDADGTQSF